MKEDLEEDLEVYPESIRCDECDFEGDEFSEDDGGFICPECGSFGPKRTKEY